MVAGLSSPSSTRRAILRLKYLPFSTKCGITFDLPLVQRCLVSVLVWYRKGVMVEGMAAKKLGAVLMVALDAIARERVRRWLSLCLRKDRACSESCDC